MTFKYNRENFWNGPDFYQEGGEISSVDHGSFYEGVPFGLSVDTNPQFDAGLFGESGTVLSSGWIQMQHPSSEEVSPSTGIPSTSNALSQGDSHGSQAPRRPSAEAVARRRKQNRVSQAAWRARNKELVEELRQEINEYSDYSQSMHQTMQSLLETTESLKGVIVQALSLAPPQASQDIRKSIGAEEQLMSPGSFTDGPMQDCDGTSRKSLT